MEFAHFSHCWSKTGMTAGQRYQQLWRELALCDQVGFDYGFSVEHHFNPIESLMSQPAVYCMGGGLNTRRMRLGPMGFVVPLYHPIRLLEDIATLDQALDGRLEVGLVSGISPIMLERFGVDFNSRRSVTVEAIRLINAAYASDGPFDFEGENFHLHNIQLSVMPVQRPRPPLWLESRNADTLRELAREGVDTGYFLYFPRAEAATRYPEYLRLWQEAGWERKPRISYLTLVHVDESDERARERGMPHALEAMRKFTTSRGSLSDVQGNLDRSAAFFEQRGEHGGAEIIRNLQNPDYLLANQVYFVGSPDAVAAQIKEAAAQGLFNVLLGEFNFGSMAEEDVMRSIRLFASEVIPQLRDFEPF